MTWDTTPNHARYGVEVHGLQLADLTPDTFPAFRGLFEAHSVLLLRGQEIDDAAHMRLAELFGQIEDRMADERKEGEAFKVPEVSNIKEDGSVTGEMDLHTLNLKANMLWHSDSTFLPIPALTNILIGRVVTEEGGQTELASTRAGWADMPERLKSQLCEAGFWHRYSHSRARIDPELAKLPMFNKWPDQLWRAVWRNPVNGEDALYIASHAYAVEGMEPEKGAALIDEALDWVTQEAYVYAHTWQPGDVLIWDQRAVLHRATPWDYNKPRKLSSICVSVGQSDGVDAMRMIV